MVFLTSTYLYEKLLKWNMSGLRIQDISAWYALKVSFNDSKYKDRTTAEQELTQIPFN
jgi:hypothetical protein